MQRLHKAQRRNNHYATLFTYDLGSAVDRLMASLERAVCHYRIDLRWIANPDGNARIVRWHSPDFWEVENQ
jgi:hypothetical protein